MGFKCLGFEKIVRFVHKRKDLNTRELSEFLPEKHSAMFAGKVIKFSENGVAELFVEFGRLKAHCVEKYILAAVPDSFGFDPFHKLATKTSATKIFANPERVYIEPAKGAMIPADTAGDLAVFIAEEERDMSAALIRK